MASFSRSFWSNSLIGMRDFFVDPMASSLRTVVKTVSNDSRFEFLLHRSSSSTTTTLVLLCMATFAVASLLVILLRNLTSFSFSSSPSSSPSKLGRSWSSMPGRKSSWYSITGDFQELFLSPNRPYPLVYLDWVRTYGGIFKYQFGRYPRVVVSDPELVKQICLKSFNVFHDRPEGAVINLDKNGFLISTGKYWADVRAAAQPLFRSVQLKSFQKAVQRTSSVLLKKLKRASECLQPVDISSLLSAYAIDTISEAAIGIPFSTQELSTGPEKALLDNLLEYVRTLILVEEPDIIDYLDLLVGNITLLRTLIALSSCIPGTKRFRFRQNVSFIQKECEKIVMAREANSDAANDQEKKTKAEGKTEEGRDTTTSTVVTEDFLTFMTKAKMAIDPTSPQSNGKEPQNKGSKRPFTNSQLASMVRELLFAGTDTTANTLTFAVYLLDKHPHVKEKLQQEIDGWYMMKQNDLQQAKDVENHCHVHLKEEEEDRKELLPDVTELLQLPYLNQVTYEVLRFLPTVSGLLRTSIENCKLGEWFIPKGTIAEIPVYAMHHLPENFQNPGEFRPERFDPSSQEHKSRHPYAFLPFGLGPRMCLGRNFALLELKTVLFLLYRHFDVLVVKESLKLNAEHDLPELDAGVTVKIKGGLCVTIHARETSKRGL